MNPTAVKARSWRTFDELVIDPLPSGCVAIVGPNGAGKSSAINIIDRCLFGRDGRPWASYVTAGGDHDSFEIETSFEHAGDLYRVRRSFNGTSALDLERRNGGGWVPVLGDGQKATQEHLNALTGLTKATWRASSFLAQGDSGAFTEATPAKRKEVFAEALGLSRYSRYLQVAKTDRKAAAAAAERLAGALDRIDAELAGKAGLETRRDVAAEMLTEATRDLAKAERDLEQVAAEAAKLEETRVARAQAVAAATDASARLAPLEQRLRDADEAAVTIGALEDELASLTTDGQRADLEARKQELEQAVRAYRDAVRAREDIASTRALREAEKRAIEAQATAIDERMRELDASAAHVEMGELDSCPTCKQTLGETARAETVAALRAQAQTLADEAAALFEGAGAIVLPEIPAEPEPPIDAEEELAAVAARLDRARQDELQRERLAERARALRDRVNARPTDAALKAARAAVAEARKAIDLYPEPDAFELDRLRANANRIRGVVTQERDRVTTAQTEQTRVTVELERIAELERASAADRAEHARLHAEIDQLATLERAYGPAGIPALLVQTALPAVEAEANRILPQLGGKTRGARVELRTEKATQEGKIVDALDIVIHCDAGEREYLDWSGSEKIRINIALRIALALLLATRRSAESRTLICDEPEFLDDDGQAALAAFLRTLIGRFDRVVLVSHGTHLREAFDTVIRVEPVDDRLSRVAA